MAFDMLERSAIDSVFRPNLFIMIALSPFIILTAVFLPLVHLDFTLQSIAVRNFYPKILVHKFNHVDRSASHVNQLQLISIIHALTVDLSNCFAALVHKLREGNKLLLVLPQEHQGEGYQATAGDEPTDSQIVFRRGLGLQPELRSLLCHGAGLGHDLFNDILSLAQADLLRNLVYVDSQGDCSQKRPNEDDLL